MDQKVNFIFAPRCLLKVLKVHGPNVVTLLNQTLTFEWYLAKLKNGHHNNTCEDDIGSCSWIINTMLNLIIYSKGRAWCFHFEMSYLNHVDYVSGLGMIIELCLVKGALHQELVVLNRRFFMFHVVHTHSRCGELNEEHSILVQWGSHSYWHANKLLLKWVYPLWANAYFSWSLYFSELKLIMIKYI